MISVSQLLIYVLLQALLIIYIKRGNEGNIQKRILVSNCDLSENLIETSLKVVPQIKNRIMAEIDVEENETVETQELPTEQMQDWISDLPEHTFQICNEYLNMRKELKDRIFLNNEELNIFLNELQEKRETVKNIAPQLLHQEEHEDIAKVKVLQYYTQNRIVDSKMWRLKMSIYYYYDMFRCFRDAWKATNEHEKIYKLERIEQYKSRLKILDPPTFVVVQNKLKNLREQLTFNSDSKSDYLFETENRTIYQALNMCQAYIDILESLEAYDEPSMKRKSYYVLYNIEKVLTSKVRDFCDMYSEEQESAL